MSGPHDALFRYVFSQPEHAASELRAVLPAALSARLDWGSLELQASSFVDEQLHGREADLLFRVGCAGHTALLYVLFEHQSTSDAFMPFRLLRYMTRIWDAFLLAHPQAQRLPAIIPVVLHHSDSGWNRVTDFGALLDVDPELLSILGDYVPRFRFVLDDLSRADDRALRGRSLTAVAAAGLMLLARGRSGPRLVDDLRVTRPPTAHGRRCWAMQEVAARRLREATGGAQSRHRATRRYGRHHPAAHSSSGSWVNVRATPFCVSPFLATAPP